MPSLKSRQRYSLRHLTGHWEQPERYVQANQDLKRARDAFIREYEGLAHLLNSQALLP